MREGVLIYFSSFGKWNKCLFHWPCEEYLLCLTRQLVDSDKITSIRNTNLLKRERELDSAKWRACSQAVVFQDKITSIFLLGVRYNEERLYDYDNPGFHPDVGHFTQVRLIKSVYLADYYLSRNKFSFLTF